MVKKYWYNRMAANNTNAVCAMCKCQFYINWYLPKLNKNAICRAKISFEDGDISNFIAIRTFALQPNKAQPAKNKPQDTENLVPYFGHFKFMLKKISPGIFTEISHLMLKHKPYKIPETFLQKAWP